MGPETKRNLKDRESKAKEADKIVHSSKRTEKRVAPEKRVMENEAC